MREQLRARAEGVARLSQSAAALWHKCGLWGQAKGYEHTFAYLKKRSRWLCSQAYRHEHLPIGSGITEAAYKIVFTQRLKRSQRYLASKPIRVTPVHMAKGVQPEQQAA